MHKNAANYLGPPIMGSNHLCLQHPITCFTANASALITNLLSLWG